MTRTRLGGLLVGLAGLVLFAVPAAAQPTTTAGLINELNGKLLYLGIPITILVEVILIYAVFKFKDRDEPKPTKENRRLEITWTIATAVILLFVGVASYGVLANPDVTYTPGMDDPQPSQGDVVVEANAFQWGWDMNYPNQNVSALTASDLDIPQTQDVEGPVILLPADQDVYIEVVSDDVIHALHVPEMGLKQDAIPGQRNTIKTHTLETGVYQGYCAEYCGVAHSKMYFNVVVVPQDTFDSAMQSQQAAANNSTASGGSSNSSASGNSTATPSGNSTAAGGSNNSSGSLGLPVGLGA